MTGPAESGEDAPPPPVTGYGYDAAGNKASVTDPLGHTTTWTYDGQNRPLTQLAPVPDGGGPLPAPLTLFGYDLAGRRHTVTDPAGNVTRYDYDEAGRLDTVTDPLLHTTDYDYDAAGQLVSVVDRNGRQRTFTYNHLGERATETWLDGQGAPVRTLTWTYDDAGRLIQASDPDSTYTYTYDVSGQVLSVDNAGTPGVPNVVLNYSYNYAGQVTSLWDNLGGWINYEYTDHRLSGLFLATDGLSQVTLSVSLGYDSIGRLSGVSRTDYSSGSIDTTYDYDGQDNVSGITHTAVVDGVPVTLSAFGYNYDAARRVTDSTGPDGELTYGYDQTGQLTSVTGSRTESYSYDANGNRTMAGYVTEDGNRLSSDGTFNYSYDNEGNVLTKVRIADGQQTEYTWDYRNRLTDVVVKEASGAVLTAEHFTYDVDGRRIGVSVNGEQTWTVYNGQNPYADFDGTGALTTRYLYGEAIDQLFARTQANGETAWYLTDRLGSVRQLVETTGTVLDEITYDSYGNIVTETNPANGDRFKFTAREWNDLSSDYYYRARYYNAAAGRFLSEDPLGYAGSETGLSAYVDNAPSNFTDPLGLFNFGSAAVGSLYGAATGAATGAFLTWYTGPGAPVFATLGAGVGFVGGFIIGGFAGSEEDDAISGIGWTGSVAAEAGVGVLGVGTQGGIGACLTGGANGPMVGAFLDGGTYGNIGTDYASTFNNPGPPYVSSVAGLFVGAGTGPVFTNANDPSQLEGPFNTVTFNAGLGVSFSMQFAWDPNSKIWISSTTFGPGVGMSFSYAPVGTVTYPGPSLQPNDL